MVQIGDHYFGKFLECQMCGGCPLQLYEGLIVGDLSLLLSLAEFASLGPERKKNMRDN